MVSYGLMDSLLLEGPKFDSQVGAFLPQSKEWQIRWIWDSKLPFDVWMRVCVIV